MRSRVLLACAAALALTTSLLARKADELPAPRPAAAPRPTAAPRPAAPPAEGAEAPTPPADARTRPAPPKADGNLPARLLGKRPVTTAPPKPPAPPVVQAKPEVPGKVAEKTPATVPPAVPAAAPVALPATVPADSTAPDTTSQRPAAPVVPASGTVRVAAPQPDVVPAVVKPAEAPAGGDEVFPAGHRTRRAVFPLRQPAVEADAPGAPVEFDRPFCGPPGRTWFGSEILMWWVQSSRLPPLVTTAIPGTPAGVAGVLGATNTSVLFGNDEVNDYTRLGFRVRGGHWLDNEQRLGIEVDFLLLEANGTYFNGTSAGGLILARPFTNGAGGGGLADLIGFPGVTTGNVTAAATSGNLLGAGIWLRENVFCDSDECSTCRLCTGGGCADGSCGNGGCRTGSGWGFRVDSILGYRFLRLSDRIFIGSTSTDAAGATTTITDDFYTSNHFHGVDLGTTAEVRRGPFFLETTAKVAVGYNVGAVRNNGNRTTAAGFANGGLLVQPGTNLFSVDRNEPTAIPELSVKLGLQRNRLRAYAGYSFLYWYHVVRAAEQVDLQVDPAFVGLAGGANPPVFPSLRFRDTDIWIQGFNFGLEVRY